MKSAEFPIKAPASTDGFIVRTPVRWSDMDAYHHINNARMATLIEEARISWLFVDDGVTAEMAHGAVVTDLRIRYLDQLRYQDGPLLITMWVTDIRAVDFTIYYEVRAASDPGEYRPAVVASTQIATFDIGTQQLRKITPLEREYLERFRR